MCFRCCKICGAALDPGEICDCKEKEDAAPGGNDTKDGKGIESMTILTSDGGVVKCGL